MNLAGYLSNPPQFGTMGNTEEEFRTLGQLRAYSIVLERLIELSSKFNQASLKRDFELVRQEILESPEMNDPDAPDPWKKAVHQTLAHIQQKLQQ